MAETQHIALPLKYRPMTFDDVVGQEHVVRTLRHAIEANRIAMAIAVGATVASAPVTIDDESCVAKSYPGFWRSFRA